MKWGKMEGNNSRSDVLDWVFFSASGKDGDLLSKHQI